MSGLPRRWRPWRRGWRATASRSQLKLETKRSSRNSSQPPSQDPPGTPPRRGKNPSGRKQGIWPLRDPFLHLHVLVFVLLGRQIGLLNRGWCGRGELVIGVP